MVAKHDMRKAEVVVVTIKSVDRNRRAIDHEMRWIGRSAIMAGRLRRWRLHLMRGRVGRRHIHGAVLSYLN
jgi:hypothetical protein